MASIPAQHLSRHRITLVFPLISLPPAYERFVRAEPRGPVAIGYLPVSESLLIAPRIPPAPSLPRLERPATPKAAPEPPAPSPGSDRHSPCEPSASLQRAFVATFGGFVSGLLLAWLGRLF